MSYLAKLKQIESNENFENIPGMELPKPPKPPFGSFGSTNTEDIEKNIINDSELKAEVRRQRVLFMLAENPETQRAFVVDTEADPKCVLVTIAIRGVASFEIRISKDRYDPFLMLQLIKRGAVH